MLSDDPTAEWRAHGAGRHWCIFVFPNMYSITSVALTLRYHDRQLACISLFSERCRSGRYCPKDLQLEVADGMLGPWRSVKTFSVSCNPEDIMSTLECKADCFHATSQVDRPTGYSRPE